MENTNIKTYRHSKWIILSLLITSCSLFFTVLKPQSASAAASNPTGTYVTQPVNYYAYVNGSENIDVSFIKQINGSASGDNNAVVTVSRPGAADVTCTITAAAAVSTACNLSNLTASSDGIWYINFSHVSAGGDY